MAFSKIVGFAVTPVTESSSIRRCISPETSKPRRMLSYQMLCPAACSASSGFAMAIGLQSASECAKCVLHDVLDCKTKFFHVQLAGRGSAKVVDSNGQS